MNHTKQETKPQLERKMLEKELTHYDNREALAVIQTLTDLMCSVIIDESKPFETSYKNAFDEIDRGIMRNKIMALIKTIPTNDNTSTGKTLTSEK